MDIKELLIELLYVPGVTGHEKLVMDKLQNHVLEFVDEIKIDEMGNLHAVKKGKGSQSIIILAHMDELGLVVCNIDDNGFIRFKKLGGIDDRILPSAHVEIILQEGGQVSGVIGWLPPHLLAGHENKLTKHISFEDMFIDIGAESREQVAELGIHVGLPIVFKKNVSLLGNNKIASRGLDNRVGCLLLIELLRKFSSKMFNGTITAVFTTQEEFGLKGAKTLAMVNHPDLAIVLDTVSAPDFPSVHPLYHNQFRLGGGPVIRTADTSIMINSQTIRKVESIADKKKIPLQRSVSGGSTDASALQLLQEGINVIPICIPCRYTHSLAEVISLDDVQDASLLLSDLITDMIG